MEKVKVGREVANAIEYALNKRSKSKERLLRDHIDVYTNTHDCWIAEYKALNDVAPMELAAILVNGYDVELTPKEILLDKYNQALEDESTQTDEWFGGYARGIEDALNILGEIVEGINK